MSTTSTAQTPIFLAGVEQNPKPSPYLNLLEAARISGGDSWQIWYLLAFDPGLSHHLAALSHKIMHQPAPITPGLRELIAAYTSSVNRCEFCMKAHAAVAAHILGDEALVWSAIENLEASPLAENEKALLRFVRKVTLDVSSVAEADIAQLHAAGWQDDAIFYAISACALFNFYNRWISASGVHSVSHDAFRRLASRMAQSGYARE